MNRVISIRPAPASRVDEGEQGNPTKSAATPKKAPAEKSSRKPIQSSTKPLPKRKPSKPRAAKTAKKSRFDLSFTARVPYGNSEPPRFTHWLPPVVPDQIDQWNKGRDLGLKMMDEIAELALDNEEEAFHAMRFACNERNWRVGGWGVEDGFAEGIAALAVVGLRYLARGAEPFDSEKPQKNANWTAQELIAEELAEVATAPAALLKLREIRALSTIAAFLNVGLIDAETYATANHQLADLVEKRSALQKTTQE